MVSQLVLQLLDAIAEIGALAPDLLERLGDLLEVALDAPSADTERTPGKPKVTHLDGTQRHAVPFAAARPIPAGQGPSSDQGRKPSSTLIRICSPASRAMIPTMGLRSSGPNIGRIFRQTRM